MYILIVLRAADVYVWVPVGIRGVRRRMQLYASGRTCNS